jgi:drug/metabolite transporter (DMT)-like permease
MGLFNVSGNLFNSIALRLTDAATVEQFHYTQIIAGALLGYLIWDEIPTQHLIVGAVIIIASGLYVAHAHYKSGRAE